MGLYRRYRAWRWRRLRRPVVDRRRRRELLAARVEAADEATATAILAAPFAGPAAPGVLGEGCTR